MAAYRDAMLAAVIICAGLLPLLSKRRLFAIAWAAAAGGILSVSIARIGKALLHGLSAPPQWDFYCFWLYGRVADIFHRPYDPRAYHLLAAGVPHDAAFTREILDVGFIYAPPTILIFAPLGVFHTTAAALPYWDALLIAICCLDAVLLWKVFFGEERWKGLITGMLLIILMPATITVFQLSQTLFMALAFLLLYLWDPDPRRKGIWLALAAVIKPFMLLIFVYSLLRKQWNTLLAGAMTLIITAIAVLPVIGVQSFKSFALHPPSARLPDWIITESANQSMLATLLRETHQTLPISQAMHQSLYLLLAASVLAVTVTAVLKAGAGAEKYGFCLLLTAGLVVYPATLYHYTVLLLLPIALLWSRRNALPWGFRLPLAFTAIEFALAATGSRQFYAFALAWLMLIVLHPVLAADQPSRAVPGVSFTSSPSPA